MMNANMVFLFILFQIMVNVAVFATKEDSTSSRSAYFTTQENVQLKGYVLKRFESASLMSCSHSCLKHAWCASTNFIAPSRMNDKGTCELNKHSTIYIHTKFHKQQGVTFSMLLKGCPMNGCHNGGSCVPDEKKQTFSCSCKVPWTGEQCATKTAKGWYSHYPAHSCIDIRDSGDSKGDGEYWIDPARSGNPLKVFCDMTTGGGGWLLVANLLMRNSTPPSSWTADASYRGIGNCHKNLTGIATSAMNELRSLINFTKLRFHCSKQQGRTFHVTTVVNSSGEAVVQYFSGQTDVLPSSCSSFQTLAGDNSQLAMLCDRWGTDGAHNVGKWGHHLKKGQLRMYDHAAFVAHMYHWVIVNGLWLCDDLPSNYFVISPEDFWKIYVR